MSGSITFSPALRGSDHLIPAPKLSEPSNHVRPSAYRSVREWQCPSQVPVLDGASLTGFPARAGGRAHQKQQRLRPSGSSTGAALVLARPSAVPLGPVPGSAQIQRYADVVAGAVPPPAQRRCGPSCACSDCGKGSTIASSPAEMATRLRWPAGNTAMTQPLAGPGVRNVASEPGEELDPEVRITMENRFESDFSDVRIHHDSRAAGYAQALGAHAYTVGNHVVFAPSRYDPASADGLHTLGHELAHVVQQRSGPVSGVPLGDGVTVSQPDDPFEQAAENTAREIVAGAGTLAPGSIIPGRSEVGAARPGVQRQDNQAGTGTGPGDSSSQSPIARQSIALPPGQIVQLTNSFTTPYGIGNPANTGPCPIILNGLDNNGNPVPVGQGFEMRLQPGGSAGHYGAPPGSVVIYAVADSNCMQQGELTIDMPVSLEKSGSARAIADSCSAAAAPGDPPAGFLPSSSGGGRAAGFVPGSER